MKNDTQYAELHCVSNFTFLRGASRPEELVETACELGYQAIAITDECSMAGVVRAHTQAKKSGIQLIIGTELLLEHGFKLVLLARNHEGYTSLCSLITDARRSAPKGDYSIAPGRIEQLESTHCIAILVPARLASERAVAQTLQWFRQHFEHAWLALTLLHNKTDNPHAQRIEALALQHNLPVVACGDVHMHNRQRRALQDVVTCIRENCTLQNAGRTLYANGERHLRHPATLARLYSPASLKESTRIASMCHFNLDQLHYEYPHELVPQGISPINYLRDLTYTGAAKRWPDGASEDVTRQIERELTLIEELNYEHYFLTVQDIVRFARENNILCQGRGSAANSAVCFCLTITEVDPMRMSMLFERFISKERNEPPDIDVDFEHERREEVIQYIYGKYGRHRTALAATVISYRRRSAIRDVGKVLGLQDEQIDALAKSMAWWDGTDIIPERLAEMGFAAQSPLMKRFAWLLEQIMGFPRHLSQHVGGFVISHQPLSSLVPVENAAMPDRTIIQWDKDDLEELGLLKVDVLALGMLTAIRKCFTLLREHRGISYSMASIPSEDPATYKMIQKADTIGVFQIESRAQMSMLPRLRPNNFYDLVIEVAIVRPGPIQGGMVNPYLKRRQGLEPVTYPNAALKRVLKRTLGVPVFQEQVMELAMVAAGFSPGEADELRRSMAAWRRVGTVERFREQLMAGMNNNGYDDEFADAVFRQIRGFGEYGFPESHAASFALLVYVSAWLKCHEPAVFLCAIMNSLPMGFYAPSDLVADARRHEVEVRELDINESRRDHHLQAIGPENKKNSSDKTEFAVRLGLRLVKNLSLNGCERLLHERTQGGPYHTIEELLRRTRLNTHDQQALAASGALESISGNRHHAHWDLLGVEQLPGILENASSKDALQQLPLISEGEDIVADYQSVGFTLKRHPLALLREQLSKKRILTTRQWLDTATDGKFARIAGLVKVRQRPGSAKGVIFMTTEDETGLANIIIWQAVTERCRKAVIGSRMVVIAGITQREGEVVHLVARSVEDYTWMLGDLTTNSRDFH
ncbi:error-prone DNA polymerase [Chromatiales bacterium (ex Bugula neritina AB1)]|nr:error-prone DNA polymerase [Chromatiales bacterium (ex Bugula neritina AB1)]